MLNAHIRVRGNDILLDFVQKKGILRDLYITFLLVSKPVLPRPRPG